MRQNLDNKRAESGTWHLVHKSGTTLLVGFAGVGGGVLRRTFNVPNLLLIDYYINYITLLHCITLNYLT